MDTSNNADIKILHIVTAEKSVMFLHGLTLFLQQQNWTQYICSNPGITEEVKANLKHCCILSVPMVREIAPLRDIVSLWKLFWLIRKIKPTIVNASTPKAGLLGMLAAWFARVPVRVFQQRGLRFETTQGINRKILEWTEKITCYCAHKVICNSDSLCQKMITLKLTKQEKAIVLCHGSSKGIDVNKFSINCDTIRQALEFREKYGIPKNSFVIGFIARIVKDKGIVELVEVFKKILCRYPDARLLVIGPEESGDVIDDDCRQWLKHSPNVIIMGRIASTAIISSYNLFDVFVFPSHREGFPNVVLEAAAMGVPTIGFNVTGVVDSIVDDETGTVVSMKDVDAMAKAVMNYLDDMELRVKHGLNARRRVVRDFQPSMLWEAYYREYCQLLRGQGVLALIPDADFETPELLNPDEDSKEFVKWYAVREIVLKNNEIVNVSQKMGVDEDEIRELLEQC